MSGEVRFGGRHSEKQIGRHLSWRQRRGSHLDRCSSLIHQHLLPTPSSYRDPTEKRPLKLRSPRQGDSRRSPVLARPGTRPAQHPLAHHDIYSLLGSQSTGYTCRVSLHTISIQASLRRLLGSSSSSSRHSGILRSCKAVLLMVSPSSSSYFTPPCSLSLTCVGLYKTPTSSGSQGSF